MKLLKLVFRNLMANGLKTWLNAFVLSVAFMLIIFLQGMMDGWNRQAFSDTIKWEISGGQYWAPKYDPYDPFSFDSAAVKIPVELQPAISQLKIEPILVNSGTLYNQGRSLAVQIKGIRPEQRLLELPTKLLIGDSANLGTIPAIIGRGMAHQTGMKAGDEATLRWRDANGTFEAQNIRVAGVFNTFVPAVDNGQLWLPLDSMQKMMLTPDAASLLIKSPDLPSQAVSGWQFKSVETLTQSLSETIKAKIVGQSIFYIIFLLLGLLAVFDTQTLAVFRRQREIGTFIALGMTKKEVISMFTFEGTLNAILAVLLAAVYGTPLCAYFAINGIPMPSGSSDFGVAIADKIYPYFSLQLVLGTAVFIILVTALVSYLPARKIAKMNPADAIKRKVI